MKKIFLIILITLFAGLSYAGPLQRAHLKVLAAGGTPAGGEEPPSETYLFKYDVDHVSGDYYAYTDSGEGSLQATGTLGGTSQAQYHSSPDSILYDASSDTIYWTTGVSSVVTAADLDECSIEIWVYIDEATQSSAVSLFGIYPDASAAANMIRAQVESAGTVYFRYEANNAVVSMTTVGTVPTQEWVRLRFHITATEITDGQIGVQINSGSWENSDDDTTPVGTLTADPDRINIAQMTYNTGYSATNSYIDDFSIIAGYDTWND